MVGSEVRGRVEGAGRGSVRGALLELRQINGGRIFSFEERIPLISNIIIGSNILKNIT